MTSTPAEHAQWAADAALRLVRKTIEGGLRCEGRWVFEIGAEPEEGQAIGNVISLTVALANHLGTLYVAGTGGEREALQRLDEIAATLGQHGGVAA
jgi:hypothetical protein